MKRLYLVIPLMMLTVAVTGCQQGKWRLRGARCRPGMSMPTYAQPPAQAPMGQAPMGQAPMGQAPCNSGYGPPGYMQGGSYMQSGGYIPNDGMVSGNVVVQEFPTSPIETQPQELQRPIISGPMVDSIDEGNVITVPGPEMGPLPNG